MIPLTPSPALHAAIGELPKRWHALTSRYLAHGTTGCPTNDAIALVLLRAIVEGRGAKSGVEADRCLKLLAVAAAEVRP